ncbi:hypothetical protein AAIH32_13105 [Pseudarthrobacter oxydans]|uniref:hypothetical protein n=1 Tax=Pseudarthrobacter oxydans TaxID=1671 RepID=UPI003D2BFEA0
MVIEPSLLDRIIANIKPKRLRRMRQVRPLSVRFYADGDDAVTAMELYMAVQNFLVEVGYGKIKLVSVERGSIFTDIKAWLDGEDGKDAKAKAASKLGDLGNAGEQWARDLTVNKARAEVAATNATTTATLLKAAEPYDNIAMHVDDYLVLKYERPNGKVVATVRKLTVKQLRCIEDNPALLTDPSSVLENLNLTMYKNDNDLAIED